MDSEGAEVVWIVRGRGNVDSEGVEVVWIVRGR